MLVEFLLKHRDKWGGWRKRFEKRVKDYEKKAGNNPLAGRLAEDFAALHVTAEIVHDANILPWSFSDPIGPLWDELVREAGEADRAAAALRHVMGWATAHQSEFWCPGSQRRDIQLHQPIKGWAAYGHPAPLPVHRYGRANYGRGNQYCSCPQRLHEILREGGI